MTFIDIVRARGRHRILGAIALATALALLAACSRPAMPPLPPGSTVLVVGDSITAGYGVDPGEAWPAQLETLTGWHVISAGISGDRSAGGHITDDIRTAAHADMASMGARADVGLRHRGYGDRGDRGRCGHQ